MYLEGDAKIRGKLNHQNYKAAWSWNWFTLVILLIWIELILKSMVNCLHGNLSTFCCISLLNSTPHLLQLQFEKALKEGRDKPPSFIIHLLHTSHNFSVLISTPFLLSSFQKKLSNASMSIDKVPLHTSEKSWKNIWTITTGWSTNDLKMESYRFFGNRPGKLSFLLQLMLSRLARLSLCCSFSS